MIPQTLSIKNFISYGALQTIDFEPYTLICLSGKNGHGKSALLDALTWAIWGQARKASGAVKADEGLLHLGQTHMMVSLDFLCNGILYRIKREYTQKKKTGQSNLEFGILDKETDTFRPLTDKTIRTTQAKIIKIVGLDYEGFTNSAFLRQGRSQEFSKKTPRERKEILAAILGLEHFEKVRRLAMDTVNETNAAKDQATALRERFSEELKEKQRVQEQLTTIENGLKQLEAKEKELTTQYELHKKNLAEAQKQKVEVEKIRFKQTHLAQALEEDLKQIRTQFSQWRSIAKKQRSSKAMPHLEKERQGVQTALNNMQLLAAKKIKLKEEFLSKKEVLRALTQELENVHKLTLAELEKKSHACGIALKTAQTKQQELTTKQTKAQQEQKELTTLLASKKTSKEVTPDLIATHEKKLERRKGFYHGFVSKAQSLKTTLSSLVQKVQLITAADQAVCPLCEQVTDKEMLTHKFNREQHLRTHQLQRLTTVCSTLKPTLIQEHQSLEALKKQREQHQVVKAQISELEKQLHKSLAESEILTKELSATQQQIQLLQKQEQELLVEKQRLEVQYQQQAHTDAFRKLYQEVQGTEKSLQAVPYDPAKEQALAAQLSALTAHSNLQQSLVKEIALQDQRKLTIHEKCTHARGIKVQLTQVTKTLPATLLDDVTLTTQEQQLTQSLTHLTKEKETLIHQKGALEAQITALKQKELELKKQEKLITEHSKKIEHYSAIASAFSKDGIQALLIEDALPEIEEEANNLLARLTDNQAHITIDSLKDTKSGKTKETLDIKISDAAGVRPYEMFSGGEAFRIDFSLRVALSKLLARRAGTALQTLIIDEGFGSQDEDGLSHIMDALHTIQGDFAKIIVVSHLTSLKDQFPVHFQVQKTPQGSMVQVIEHC